MFPPHHPHAHHHPVHSHMHHHHAHHPHPHPHPLPFAAPVLAFPAPAVLPGGLATAPAAGAATRPAASLAKALPLASTAGRLPAVLDALGAATAAIADALRGHWSEDHGHHHKLVNTTNTFGDQQLAIDVVADKIVFDALKATGAVKTASSEETAREVDLGGSGFSVAFDPLDGSSIVDANFAVGSIYGVWPGAGLVGRTGDEQCASAIAIYGPRTTMAVGLPASSTKDGKAVCLELTFADGEWHATHEKLVVKPDGKVFAPGNLRATADNPKYRRLVDHWISQRYTLRYTGGMVPDVYHILVKGKGIFTNVPSEKAPAKLRLLYEGHPVAMVLNCAGAESTDDQGTPLLSRKVLMADERTGICTGSKNEVATYLQFMKDEKPSM